MPRAKRVERYRAGCLADMVTLPDGLRKKKAQENLTADLPGFYPAV